ncbi:RsiV family protein [Microbacteriaceae bacterium K1510]|nr:RsiV family protein [Microbacteriaceae bacterium K1510]
MASSLSLAPLAAAAPDAEKAKPAASIDTKTIEASIIIEDALKAYPGLYDNLLAEGRREMAKWRTQADKDRKEMPDIFRESRRYSFERTYSERSAITRYVSVERVDYMDGLGAHPNHNTDVILWDSEAKKRVSIRPFFKETADDGATMQTLAKAIRTALVAEKKARDIPDADKDPSIDNVKPKILSIGAIALAPSTEKNKSSGLITFFSPYAVGAYAEGGYVVFVPWTVFKDRLSPEGTALFGGERPADDAKKDEQ